jgi:peptidylprolyl isomerase
VTKAVTIPNVPPPTVTTIQEVTVGTGAPPLPARPSPCATPAGCTTAPAPTARAQFDDNGTSDAVLTVAGRQQHHHRLQYRHHRHAGWWQAYRHHSAGPRLRATAQPAGKYGIPIPANSTLVFDITLVSIQ